MTTKFYIQKWQIVKWSTIIIATAFALILLNNGLNEASFRIAIPGLLLVLLVSYFY
jgi:hypothetical protein